MTQLLRSNLLSIREALFRHASFLEFLPAPETVDRTRVVPGGDADGIPSRTPGDEEEDTEGIGEDALDPEVRGLLSSEEFEESRAHVGKRLHEVRFRGLQGSKETPVHWSSDMRT